MVVGTLNVTLEGAKMQHDASAVSYYRGALDFLNAAELLAAAAAPAAPIGLVAAYCLELALKAYLLHVGLAERQLREVGHSLQDAWSRAAASGLPIDQIAPDWVAKLDAGHDRPFHFRYARDNTGLVLPAAAALVDALRIVVSGVKEATGVS